MSAGELLVDLRGFEPSLCKEVVFTLVDKFVELATPESIVFVCDHDPEGLGYQVDLRRRTRGRFTYRASQRSDGAWAAVFEPLSPASDRHL